MPRHNRHSFIAFFPSDWIAGTAHMPPMQRLVYFDICVQCWDHGAEVPAALLPIMFRDIPDWRDVIDRLVTDGKLHRSKSGNIGNSRAIFEGKKAYAEWSAKSKGGKTRAKMLKAQKRLSGKNDGVESIVESTAESTCTPEWSPPENQNQNQNQKNLESLSSLPSLNSETKRNFKSILDGLGNGKTGETRKGLRNGADVTIASPNERLARFQAKLAVELGADGDDGWTIVAAAIDDTNPQHSTALALCKRAASRIGKGWPSNWPTKQRHQ